MRCCPVSPVPPWCGWSSTGAPRSPVRSRDARPGDVVVVAGKGHETGQTAQGRTVPFDDRLVAREALEALGWS